MNGSWMKCPVGPYNHSQNTYNKCRWLAVDLIRIKSENFSQTWTFSKIRFAPEEWWSAIVFGLVRKLRWWASWRRKCHRSICNHPDGNGLSAAGANRFHRRRSNQKNRMNGPRIFTVPLKPLTLLGEHFLMLSPAFRPESNFQAPPRPRRGKVKVEFHSIRPDRRQIGNGFRRR